MIKRLISLFLTLVLLAVIPLSARYRYNPYTTKLDYYEAAGDVDLGDIGDITLTGLATGNVLYYNGTAWVNLATGANGRVLTLAGGIPSWAAGGAPAAHAASHEVAGADLVDHDLLTNYLAARHIDHTAVSILTAGLITGGGTIDANRTVTLTEATIEAAIDTLPNLTNIQGQAVTLGNSLTVEAGGAAILNQDLTTDSTPTFGDITTSGSIIFSKAAGTENEIQYGFSAFIFLCTNTGVGNYGGTGVYAPAGKSAFMDVYADAQGGGATFLPMMEVVADFATTEIWLDGSHPIRMRSSGDMDDYILFRTVAHVPEITSVGGADFKITSDSGAINFDNETLKTTGEAEVKDITISTPVNVYALSHNSFADYAANQHVVLPNTIANVLSDHNLAAHTALGLFDASGDVDHNLTTNYVANQHINWTAAASNFSTSEDFFLAWTEAADHAAITQTAVAGVATVPLINIDDDRTGVTADTVGESTIVMNAAGTYAFYVQTGDVQFDAGFEVLNVFSYDYTVDHNLLVGYLAGQDLTAGQGTYNTLLGELAGADITTGDYNIVIGYLAGRLLTTNSYNIIIGTNIASVAASAAHSNVILGHDAAIELTNGYENIIIGKEAARDLKSAGLNVIIGWQASLEHESGNYNTIVGTQAGYGVAGSSNYAYNTFIGMQAAQFAQTAAVRNVIIGYQTAEDLSTGTDNIVIGYMAGEGWLDTENEKLVIDVTDTTSPLIYGDFNADNISINGDLSVLMDAALDQILFQQLAVAGTEDQPLIFIDDDRTGTTAQEQSEASLYIDAEGVYALYILDGQTGLQTTYMYASSGLKVDDGLWSYGGGDDILIKWDSNGAGDDLYTFSTNTAAAGSTAALFYSEWALNPTAMTDHDDYLSPTFVIANWESADANDYAGVVIGERAQASVLVAHYFDFYAMTGSVDGSANPANAELAAIFRFGASGTATPGYATTPGDVLFEGAIEVDGSKQVAGYNRYDYISWNDCFDHGSTVAKYDQDWETAALNTQGNGTNTIQTNPSHITLTTDNNAIGDNEGTRTDYQIIERARLNRTEFGCTLGQTANTQYYMGWNTSGTNAMVPAADEYVIVFFDVSDNANWQIKVGDGATEDVFTSAIAGAATFIRHEIWVESDGTVHWAVNGTELDITGSVDNLMTASDHYLIAGQAQSVTGAAAIVAEICYVENEKTKIN